MTGSVARRYAKALFAIAKEASVLEPVADQLRRLVEVCLDPGIAPVLRNPLLSASRRRDLARLLLRTIEPSELVAHFVELLAERQRLSELPGIARHFDRLLDHDLGRLPVTIRTAVALQPAQEKEIVATFSRMTGKEVIPTVVLEPDLLGGVVVEAEGKVYDGSVRAQFARIARDLAGSSSL